jgi:hypothetical protein
MEMKAGVVSGRETTSGGDGLVDFQGWDHSQLMDVPVTGA